MLPHDIGITITLRVADGRVARAEIGSNRLVQASSMLDGRRPEQALAVLPTLFSLCGTAQGLAGLEAVENAAGIDASPAQRKARHILCRVEMVAEHLGAAFRDWPPLLGEAPDLVALKPLRPLVMAARKALYPAGDWTAPGGGRLAPDREALADIVHRLGEAVARGDLVADRLISRIEDENLEGFGAVPPNLMPEGGPPDLDARLAADHDGSYRARPDYGGGILETGPLARQSARPLMGLLMGQYGNGLMPRFSARMMEMATALRELEDLVQDLSADPGGAPGGTDGTGLGMVEAARGLLVHRLELREGLLRDYRILAPTEWNFHPEGPLVLGLRGIPAGEGLEWRAGLLAAALDPCVPHRIEVAHA